MEAEQESTCAKKTDLTVTFKCGDRELGFTLPQHRQLHDMLSFVHASRLSPFATLESSTLAYIMAALIAHVCEIHDKSLGLPSIESIAEAIETKLAANGYNIVLNRAEVPEIFKSAFTD